MIREPGGEMRSTELHDLAKLRERLGRADALQIRLQMSVSPSQRIENMLAMQDLVIRNWRGRLRRSHPDISDLDLCLMMFERLKRNG